MALNGKTLQHQNVTLFKINIYRKTGNFCVRLIFANFAIVIKTRKLIFVNIFAQYYIIWVQLEKCKF